MKSQCERLLNYETAHKLFNYDPATGVLTRKISIAANAKAGDAAGSVRPDGYLRVWHGKKIYYIHRIIWLMVYGDWPENQVDHIDGDPSNNKISNLRPATNKGNGRNAKKHSRNKSGLMGVGWLKSLEKWRVRIGTTHIGVANDFFDACCLRKAAEIEHGYHKNHGREI